MTVSRLAREYNKGLEDSKAEVQLHNEKMTSELMKVGANQETIDRCLLPTPVECPPLDGRWIRRFLQLMHWRKQPVNTAGTYLEWTDPRLVSSRKKLHEHLNQGVHKYLVLNCDQVWRQSLRPGKTVWMKSKNRFLAFEDVNTETS